MRNHFRKTNAHGKGNNSSKKQVEVTFSIIDKQKVGIDLPYLYCVMELKNIFKHFGNGFWDYDSKCWIINRSSYNDVLQKVQDYFFNLHQRNQQIFFKVHPIQSFVIKAQQILKQQVKQLDLSDLQNYSSVRLKYNQIQTKIDAESLPFYDKLFDFQKQSLKFGIQKHGRLLLADEMGVGKTIQSLAIAYIYKHEWPLLIICPPTLKINWQNQIKRWYPNMNNNQIQLINSAKAAFRNNVQILIISYDLAWRMKEVFDHIKIVIADQAHYLKNSDAKRTQILVPFLTSRKRVILLTGTPAFARPRQIFNLVSIVNPNLFKNFKQFGNRYCDPKWNHWAHTYEYNGCKNMKQLHYILKNNIMIRRLKCEVLKQLPQKNRQKVSLQTDNTITKQIKQLISKNNISTIQTFFSQSLNQINSTQDRQQSKQDLMLAYRLSGMAKIKAVKQYLMELLQNDIKILVFAHHIKVLDQIQTEMKHKKVNYMRIDGSVTHADRSNNVERFQNDPQLLVALLSITAAGVGITLTAASTVVFAELHWTPALMIQAQDRAHRITQKSSVNCHYLIGQNTLDDILYRFLDKKVSNVSSFVDGQSKDFQIQQIKKGQKGKFSKNQKTMQQLNRQKNKKQNMLQPVDIQAVKRRKLQRLARQEVSSSSTATDVSIQMPNQNDRRYSKQQRKMIEQSIIRQKQMKQQKKIQKDLRRTQRLKKKQLQQKPQKSKRGTIIQSFENIIKKKQFKQSQPYETKIQTESESSDQQFLSIINKFHSQKVPQVDSSQLSASRCFSKKRVPQDDYCSSQQTQSVKDSNADLTQTQKQRF